MPLRKDIWRPAIVEAPAGEIYARGGVEGLPWRWLPDEARLRFTADPFGLWRDGGLFVFVERFDYRDRVGRIDVLVHDAELRLIETRPALAEPWHLSYPLVFEGEGAIWLLPEAYHSGKLTLYRAASFPDRWEAAATLALDAVPIDASIARHQGRWWLFYSPASPRAARTGALHVACADRLAGPWRPHPGNPVMVGHDRARPGGTPIPDGDGILLPVQDCSSTYGGAVRPLRITTLSPDRFAATLGGAIRAPAQAGRFAEGLHTISAAGPVTLVDVKRTELSARSLLVEAGRRGRTLFNGAAGRDRRA